MEKIILSKNNKQTNKNRAWPKGADLGFQGGEKGEGVGGMGIWGLGGCKLLYLEWMGMGFYCIAQGNVCDWVTLLYNTTDETL